ncbi:MAG: phage holin family protein, partial [Acidobacteriales bacterium]|nr:phage holin family protein [Terriglobales bacterium]
GGTAMGWCFSGLILFVLYSALGGGLAVLGKRAISETGLMPTHTLKVLKQDQTWLQQEAKTQL